MASPHLEIRPDQSTSPGGVASTGYRKTRLLNRNSLEDTPLCGYDYAAGRNNSMSLLKHTVGISRADLTRDCLQQIRLWPGCESIERLGVLGDMRGGFSVHVIEYGTAKKGLPIVPFVAFNVRSSEGTT
jgi:hypothetical protein